MQRLLITLTVIVLVVAALAMGALAAHWPFWHRAWQWHTAVDGWPETLPGPTVRLAGGDAFLPLRVRLDPRLAARIGTGTRLLMAADHGGQVAAWFAPGSSELSLIDGRGLTGALAAPLLASLGDTSLLDVPLRGHLPAWQNDARGAITARQLLWQLSGLSGASFAPLNPFSRGAQLASGPDFERAALHTRLVFPPGTHFEEAPANSQLLALLVEGYTGAGFAAVLEQRLWSRIAAHEALGVLDHRRGRMAGHCCIRAAAVDWLRLGLLLAADGEVRGNRVLPQGAVAAMSESSPVHPGYGLGFRLGEAAHGVPFLVLETTGRRLAIAPHTGRSVLWVGQGSPPVWLDELLVPERFELADNPVAE